MLSMHCTLPWNGLALQIRRFEMPPLCKLAMWHFCVRRKGHPTCWNIPNLENQTCSSHSHVCTSALISHCAPLKLQILCLPRTCPWDHQIHTYMFSPSFTCLLRPLCECTCIIEAKHSLSADVGAASLGPAPASSPLIITQWLCFNALL